MKKQNLLVYSACLFLSLTNFVYGESRIQFPPQKLAKIFDYPGELSVKSFTNSGDIKTLGQLYWTQTYRSPSNSFFVVDVNVYKGKSFFYYSEKIQEGLKRAEAFAQKAMKEENFKPPYPGVHSEVSMTNSMIAHYLFGGMGPGGSSHHVFATTPDQKFDIVLTVHHIAEGAEPIFTSETKAYMDRILSEKQGVAKLAIKVFPEIYSIIEPQLK